MSSQTQPYKQLAQGQRYQLAALLSKGFSQRQMAEAIGVHHTTVSREIRRNSMPDGYCPEAAQKRKTSAEKDSPQVQESQRPASADHREGPFTWLVAREYQLSEES